MDAARDPHGAVPGGPASGRLEFRLLGPLEVLRGGVPVTLGPPRLRVMLAILLLNIDRVVTVERLMDEM